MNRTRKKPADSKHKKGRAEVCPGVSLADPLGVFAIWPVSYPGALTPCIPLQFRTAGWCQRSFSHGVRETWVCIQFLDENSFLVVCLLQLEMTHLRHANLIGTGEKGNYLQRELQHKCRMTLISQTFKCAGIASCWPGGQCGMPPVIHPSTGKGFLFPPIKSIEESMFTW